jgi:hypothetical protein
MPNPTKVWMVALGRTPMEEIVGELSLEQEGLMFEPHNDQTPATRLRFDSISKVSRLKGSPVLMLTHVEGDTAKTHTAFYFTQPPALTHIVKSRTSTPEPDHDLRPLRPSPFGLGQRRPSKRRTVRTNATYLAQEGSNRRRELQEWVDEIRAEMRRG